ncbi:uncharacterized protein LOC125061949 isoform X1 [Pieris napi]|uniref:uncharacterized protein LOC125061949 isoform X1 n=1 Tax=Pieris napi TaxID=78633 RepID=UPI001FB9F61F|nr:uncharacterized protein LOC125061949 isoform X1 [Pieris napi]
MSSQRGIKFNDSETTRFLELYSMEKVLYDPSLEKYRDRDLRAAAAKRISHELNIPGFGPKEVISKFKNLRSSFCQELKKISDSARSGKGTDDIYKPKVFWFDQMNSFIRPFVQQRPTQPNLAPNTQATSTESESQNNTVPSRNKRKIKDPLPNAVDVLEKATQHFSNTYDEFDLFGQTIAEQLRQLPLEIALETEEMLLSTVRKQRIKLAKKQTSNQQVRHPPSSA